VASKSELEIVITGKDKASKELKKVRGSVDDISKSSKGLKESFMDAATSIGVSAASIGAAIYTAKQVFDFGYEGAQILELKQLGDTLASSVGQNMQEIMDAMRDASENVISDYDLMQAANKALRLGVAQTPEQFGQLTKSAIALGQALGVDATQAVSDLTTGIGRMSPMILDNLGVMTEGGAVFENYAASLGKAADELTEAEKKQALLNVAIRDATPLLDEHGNLIETTATGYQAAMVEVENLADSMKEMAAPAVLELVKNLGPLVDDVTTLVEISRELKVAVDNSAVFSKLADAVDIARKAFTLFISPVRLSIDGLHRLLDVYRQWKGETGGSIVPNPLPGSITGRAKGGPLSGFNVVGEKGYEFVLGNIVIPHDLSKKLASIGVRPRKGFYAGGDLGDDERWSPYIPGGSIAPAPVGIKQPTPTITTAPAPIAPITDVIEEITQEATEFATEKALMQIQPMVNSQTRVVASGMGRQTQESKGTNRRLDKLIHLLENQPSRDDMQQIMIESRDTSGF